MMGPWLRRTLRRLFRARIGGPACCRECQGHGGGQRFLAGRTRLQFGPGGIKFVPQAVHQRLWRHYRFWGLRHWIPVFCFGCLDFPSRIYTTWEGWRRGWRCMGCAYAAEFEHCYHCDTCSGGRGVGWGRA